MRLIPVLILLFALINSVYAMEINANPRSIVSSLDKSLSPELDILRVTTDISSDNLIVFQVKTKGERAEGEKDDYLLLQVLHEKVYVFLIPINKENGNKLLIYEDILRVDDHSLSRIFEKSNEDTLFTNLIANQILNGAEFLLPLDWINFGANFGFDAYTVQASVQEGILQINKIYDQAGKGRNREKSFSAILLLNKLCAPKKFN